MKKKIRAGTALLACVLAMSSTGVETLAAGAPIVQVRSTSQSQMQSELETVYVNTVGNPTVRRQNFDDNWKFNLGDVRGAESRSFDDSKWSNISVPHDYSITQDYQENLEAESGYLPGGTGWYRKYFTVTEEMKNKRLRIEFDGVYMNATVYVNGTELGTHPFGYTPFSFDITDYVNVGEENVIAVKVDHKTPSSRWYSGSGIYRSVHLSVMDNVHVDLYGQKIETPSLESQLGQNVTMKVNTTVVNESDAPTDVTVKHTVYPKGNESQVIASADSAPVKVEKGTSQKIETTFDTTSAPNLWSVKSPSLYIVRTEVKAGDAVLDTMEEEFGFRHFKMDKETGAYLNGEPIKLKGVCMHHDQGSLGAAAYRRAIERQVDILKQMGANSIRVTHNPAAEVLIDICNEKGMLVVDELFDGWMHAKNQNTHDYSMWFNKKIDGGNMILGGNTEMTWAEFDLKTTLRRGQNDPSIIMWSLGNEIQEGANGDGYAKKAEELIQWAKDTDATRVLTIGSNAVKGSVGNANNDHIQIANQLTAVGGASGTNYSNGKSYDSLHSQYPEWNLYGSETASAVNSRGIYTTKNSATLDKNKQLTSYDKSCVSWGAVASEAWYDVIQRDFVAGEYIWTGFDYIGEPTPANGITGGAQGAWPSPKNSYFGIVDTAGFPKDTYYFYQSQWNDEVNTLHILPTWNENTVIAEGNEKKVEVVVYSDAKKVELYLDPIDGSEKLIGTQTFETIQSKGGKYSYQMASDKKNDHTGMYMTFQVPFEEGTLRAVAYDENGKEIQDTQGRKSVTTSGEAKKLVAKADRTEIVADGHDLTYIEVDVQDKDGNFVPDAKDRVTFQVEGEGELVGVDNGSSPDHDSYTANNRCAHAGKVLAIVKARKTAGSFTVTASADGLESSTVTVNTKATGDNTATKEVMSYQVSRNFYVKKGTNPALPTDVEVRYTDGTKDRKEITWEPFSEEQLNSDETFLAKGIVDGNLPIQVNVTMISNVATVLDYSTTVAVGTKDFQLPVSRPAVLEDGRVLNVSFDVEWDSIPEGAFAQAGKVEVNGKTNLLGQTENVKATIRVQEEKIEIGENIGISVARLEQSIAEEHQSDTLVAITDGSKKYDPNKPTPNSTCWSNYNYSQLESNHQARKSENDGIIHLEYDTQQRIGQIQVTFFRDNWSARYPKAGATEFYVGDTKLEITKETIPEEAKEKKVGTVTYTYDFAPVLVTDLDIVIHNRPLNENDPTGNNGTIKPCTGITEVEIFKAIGSFTTGETAELETLTLNGKDLTPEQLKQGFVNTPALVAKLENIQTKDNASVTELPVYNNVKRLLLESEDHKTMNVFEIRLGSPVPIVPDEPSNDVKCEPEWVIADNEQNPDNLKTTVVDENEGTFWHTKWEGVESYDESKRWIGFNFDEPKVLDGLRYLPRTGSNAGDENGRVTKYRVEYKTTDESDWQTVEVIGDNGEKATEASWSKEASGWQAATFFEPIEAKQIRLVGVETYADSGNNKHMSCVELRVTQPAQKTDISGYTVELEGVTDGVIEFPYLEEGQEVRPAVTVKDADGNVLEWGIDYKVTYTGNNAFGNAEVLIEGIQQYSGSIAIPFEIRQTPQTLTAIFVEGGYTKTYTEGDTFNPEGLVLKRVYSDRYEDTVAYSAENASEFAFAPGLDTLLKETDHEVLVTYGGLAAKLEITVSKKTVDPNPEKPNPEKPNPEKPNPEKPDPGKPNPEQPDAKPTPDSKPTSKPEGKPGANKGEGAVQTGDATNVIFQIAGITVAGILIGVVGYRRKRK